VRRNASREQGTVAETGSPLAMTVPDGIRSA
jgi:hypothetical protein